jgi:hypothetical protein
MEINENKIELVKNIKPNVIHNRFDILYNDDFTLYLVNDEYIPFHIERNITHKHIGALHGIRYFGKIGIYLRDVKTENLNELIKMLFVKYPLMESMDICHTYTFIAGIDPKVHWHVILPDTIEQFDKTLPKKVQQNLNRRYRHLKENVGECSFKRYAIEDVTLEIEKKFLKWKYITHKIRLAENYLKTCGATDVFIMYIKNGFEETMIAIRIITITDENVYFENNSYNQEYAQYSPSVILYHHIVAELIAQKKKLLFLLGGTIKQKSDFNGICTYTYTNRKYNPIREGKLKMVDKILLPIEIKNIISFFYEKFLVMSLIRIQLVH